jgi:hypothetical protein
MLFTRFPNDCVCLFQANVEVQNTPNKDGVPAEKVWIGSRISREDSVAVTVTAGGLAPPTARSKMPFGPSGAKRLQPDSHANVLGSVWLFERDWGSGHSVRS